MRHCRSCGDGSSLSNFTEGPRLSGIGMTSARTRERLVQRLQEQWIADQRVLDRIRNVPRHLFMDEALASRAYEDTALPIGFGQTISQPFVVARMTEALLAAGGPHKGGGNTQRGGGARCANYEFAMRIFGMTMATSVGPRARLSMRSCSPRRRTPCLNRCSI